MSLAWPLLAKARPHSRPGWSVRRVGDLVTLINGHPFDSASFGPTGMPLVRIRDLQQPEFETYVTGQVPRRAVLKDGDLVVGMDGEFNVVRWHRGEAALNQRLCLLRPRPDVDLRFVCYALPALLEVLNDLAYSTTVKHLSSYEILSERMLVPPLDEQRRIADFLDDQVGMLDRAIDLCKQEVVLLDERRDALLSHGFGATNDLFGMIQGTAMSEHGWRPRRLSPLLRTTLAGGTPPTEVPEFWDDSDTGTPWVSIGDMAEGARTETTSKRLSAAGLATARLRVAPAGTVLLAMYASVGKTTVLATPAVWNQAIIGLVPGPLLRDRFLLNWLELIRPVLPAIARSATQDNLNAEQVKAFRIPLPSLAEQDGLVDAVAEADARASRLRCLYTRQVILLSERKEALITAAVTGEFDVTTARSVA